MECEHRYWRWSEEANAEHVEDLKEEVRHAFALDEVEPTEAWKNSEEGFYLAKAVDGLAARIAEFVGSDFLSPPARFVAEMEAVLGLRIRQVLSQHPFAELRKQFGVTEEGESGLYVAIDVEAEDLLRTLIRLRLGYERRHWHVERVIEAATWGLVVRSERGRAYFARMLNCYVVGFDDETIFLARSVLEAELESILNGATGEEAHLFDLINAAACRGMLGGSVFEAAHRVRTAGNDTGHVMLGLWCIAAVMRDLQMVLKTLA